MNCAGNDGADQAKRHEPAQGSNQQLGLVAHSLSTHSVVGGSLFARNRWVSEHPDGGDQNCHTEGEGDGDIIVKAQFAEHDLAELFRREFQGNYGD